MYYYSDSINPIAIILPTCAAIVLLVGLALLLWACFTGRWQKWRAGTSVTPDPSSTAHEPGSGLGASHVASNEVTSIAIVQGEPVGSSSLAPELEKAIVKDSKLATAEANLPSNDKQVATVGTGAAGKGTEDSHHNFTSQHELQQTPTIEKLNLPRKYAIGRRFTGGVRP